MRGVGDTGGRLEGRKEEGREKTGAREDGESSGLWIVGRREDPRMRKREGAEAVASGFLSRHTDCFLLTCSSCFFMVCS